VLGMEEMGFSPTVAAPVFGSAKFLSRRACRPRRPQPGFEPILKLGRRARATNLNLGCKWTRELIRVILVMDSMIPRLYNTSKFETCQ
jgi:hypothetical protein